MFDGKYRFYPRCYSKQESIFQLCWFHWERQEPHITSVTLWSLAYRKILNIHIYQLSCPCSVESKSQQSLRIILPLQSILAERYKKTMNWKIVGKKSKWLVLHSNVIYLYFLDFKCSFQHIIETWKARECYHMSCFHSKKRHWWFSFDEALWVALQTHTKKTSIIIVPLIYSQFNIKHTTYKKKNSCVLTVVSSLILYTMHSPIYYFKTNIYV